MADTSDVQAALVLLLGSVLYPAGLAGAGGYDQAGGYDVGSLAYGDLANLVTSSAAGLPVRIYRGWPVAEQLDIDLNNGIAHVTVFEQTGMTRLSGGNLDPDISIPVVCTLAASATGNVVTFSGACAAGQLAGVEVGGASWYYPVQAMDTPLVVAEALAAVIGGSPWLLESGVGITDGVGNPILLNGGAEAAVGDGGTGVLTIDTTLPVTARTGQGGQSRRRPREQEQGYCITCWAPDPASRDEICSTLDAVLSDTRWLQLPDQAARLLWHNTRTDDVPSKAWLWRRDLTYTVRYWTTRTTTAPPMLWGGGRLSGVPFGDAVPAPATGTVYEDVGGNLLLDERGNLIGVPPG
jgi:hypothetical protein